MMFNVQDHHGHRMLSLPLPHYGLLYLTMVSPSHVSPDPLCTQWVITASCFSCIYYFPVLLIFVSIFFTFCAVMGSPRH